jgi:hypothetical protein
LDGWIVLGLPQVLAQLPRASARQSSSILSSIEFDRDGQLFATAGVSKRVSIYEYSAVINNPMVDVHRPSQEIVTRSKISCLSWNKYIKSHIINSDYEGVHNLPLGRPAGTCACHGFGSAALPVPTCWLFPLGVECQGTIDGGRRLDGIGW